MSARAWQGYSDTDYAKYQRHIGGTVYHIIRADADPDADDEYGDPLGWFVGLSLVDIATIETASIGRFAGFEQGANGIWLYPWDGSPVEPDAWAESAANYGNRAPLRDWTIRAKTAEQAERMMERTIRKAKRLSGRLELEPGELEGLMSRPVNAIGSTASEYMQGDIYSALHRGVKEGNADAMLVTRMYQASGGQTLGAGNVLARVPHLCPGTDDDGNPLKPDAVTCGICGRSVCDRCDPSPSALCVFCHGRGYSDAELSAEDMTR